MLCDRQIIASASFIQGQCGQIANPTSYVVILGSLKSGTPSITSNNQRKHFILFLFL